MTRIVPLLSLFALAACGGGSGPTSPSAGADTAVAVRASKSAGTGDTATAAAALTVTSSLPGDGGNNQPRSRQPSFTFSSLLNAASVNGGNFALNAGALPVPAMIRVIDRVARLEPESKLLPQTTYTVRAAPGILDTLGQTLAEPVQRSFVTADAGWKETLQLPFTGLMTGVQVSVALDPKGNGWGAWSAAGVVYVNRFDVGTGVWSPPQAISGNPHLQINEPQLAADGAGNAVLVWAQGNQQRLALYASRFTAATGSWEMPRLISTDAPNSANAMARVVARADGVITVAWRRAGAGVYASTASMDTNFGWVAPIRIDDPDTPSDNAVATLAIAVSPTPGGRAAIAWSTGNLFENAEVWVSEFSGSVPWPFARPRKLSNPGSVSDREVGVSVDGAGQVHVLWHHDESVSSSNNSTLQFAHFDGSNWSAPRALGPARGVAFGNAIASNTELGRQSATWVSWLDTFGSSPRVMAARLRGGTADAPQVIGLPPVSSLNVNQRSALTVDRAGNVVVGWTTGTTSAEGRVMAARYVARLNAWQAVRTLDQQPLGSSFTPILAGNAVGDVLVAWRGFNSDPFDPTTPIFTKRFD